MTIPRLNQSSGQNWRNPTYVKNSHQSDKSTNRFDFGGNFKRREKKNGQGLLKKLLSFAIPIAIFLCLLGGVFALAAVAWISRDLPTPDGVINRSITVSTKIYDRTGETVLYDIHGDIKRTLIQLDQVPKNAINATLAAEDRNFYQHKGFSITGIIRSVIKNVLTGSKVGGSTLTQQFVKNAVLTGEKTYTRKIKEFIISYQLEKKFTKDEILQMYFNEIPYGSVIYGIEAASQSFFGKSAKDLTLAESAILAAIPQAPTFYSPYGNNKDRLIVRQRYVLDSMAELGYISQEEAAAAKEEKIIFKPLQESMIAPHFVMYIRELLSEKYGEDFITQEGLRVYTTLDLDKQKAAEEAVTAGVAENSAKYNFTNASLVALDPQTGQILAMVGSADYFNEEIDGQVNVALRPRQPGSSFKPIVYAASFINGYTPDTILYDVVTNFDATGAKPYEPKNYNLKENGPVTIRKALAGSLNIPAVKVTYLTGVENVLNFAETLGYSTFGDRSRFGLSLVLGGGEVKLLEHVSAFSAFANDGVKYDINPILKIEDKDGKVLYKYQEEKKKVMEPQISRLINDILSDDEARSYVFGSGSRLTLPGRPVAAKTGTTNDYKDAWTIGYTPDLVAGVWVGNNDSSEMKRGADGSIIAAPIWNQFMREALKDSSVKQFTEPEEIITGKQVLDGQTGGDIKIKIDTMSGKLATQYTPESTIKEISSGQIHSILYYVNKDDPRGDWPQNPADDPQFSKWEEAVLRWAKENGYNADNQNQDIPTDYDDIHLPEDQPNLIIITPLPNQTVSSRDLDVDITASSKRGVRKIEYYLDNKLFYTSANKEGETIALPYTDNGYHTLKISAKDDLENTASQTVELNLLITQKIPSLNWTSPQNNSTVSFPLNLTANLINWEQIKKIDFYYQKENSNTEQFIGYIQPSGAQISLPWGKKPENGTYLIYGNLFDYSGKKYSSEKITINIK